MLLTLYLYNLNIKQKFKRKGGKLKMKQERGITLIALVITIIVLLILAGVSIAMLTGENGLLNRSKSAVVESKIAECKEHVMLTVNELVEEFYEEKYVNNKALTASEDTLEKYVSSNLKNKLDSKYASAGTYTVGTNVIITLTEKNPDDSENYITGTYESISTDKTKLGTITWSYTGKIDTSTPSGNTTP